MTPYLAILNARFHVLIQYRAAALAGFGTQLFWGLIRVMIFTAFYDSARGAAPADLHRDEVITYIWLGQAMLHILPWNLDPDIRAMVRTGTVAYEMLRPVDLYWTWYVRALAQRTAPTLLRCVPLFIIAGLFFGLHPPTSAEALFAWIVATAAALALGCAISTLMNITLVSTLSGDGIARLIPSLVYSLSGMVLPIALAPEWLKSTINFLPFRALVDTPFRAYLGHIPLRSLALEMAHPVAWSILLILIGRLILARSLRRLVVQGG